MSAVVGFRSTARGVAVLSVLVGIVGLGCSEAPAPSPVDAGVRLDAPDAGSEPDAPSATDAPADLDAPSATDAGPRPDGPLLPPVDAGDPFGDAGTLGTPEWVPIDVLTTESCATLTPCGGDVVGTWDVTGGCVEIPIPDAFFACPGATAVGSGMGRGRVTFTGTVARRTAQSVASVAVFLPAVCAGLIGGCDGLETMLQGAVPDSACVTEAAGCRCEARQHFGIDDGDLYSIEGNEIVSTTSGRRWAYCIAGDELRYEDTTPPGGPTPNEPGIIELGRR